MTNHTQLAMELEETAANFWKPQPGDAIAGELIAMDPEQGQKNNSTIYTLELENGEELKFWGCSILDKTIKVDHIGDTFLIKYFGKKQSKDGNNYNSYAVKRIPKDQISEGTEVRY